MTAGMEHCVLPIRDWWTTLYSRFLLMLSRIVPFHQATSLLLDTQPKCIIASISDLPLHSANCLCTSFSLSCHNFSASVSLVACGSKGSGKISASTRKAPDLAVSDQLAMIFSLHKSPREFIVQRISILVAKLTIQIWRECTVDCSSIARSQRLGGHCGSRHLLVPESCGSDGVTITKHVLRHVGHQLSIKNHYFV